MNLISVLVPSGLRLINRSESPVLSMMASTLNPSSLRRIESVRKREVGQSKTDLASPSLEDWNRRGQTLGI